MARLFSVILFTFRYVRYTFITIYAPKQEKMQVLHKKENKKMNVTVQIHYITDSGDKVLQRGSFPAKGRKPEKVAYDWWRELKKEMPVEIKLVKVIIDGEEQTEKVKEIEKAPLF